MSITAMKRHTPTAANKDTGKSLPIVRYHELELDGPFTTAIITVIEDGMWRSNVMRLAAYTAAEVQAGLTGRNATVILDDMFRRQKANPLGKDAKLCSDVAVTRTEQPASAKRPSTEKPTAIDTPTGKRLPIVAYRELRLRNLDVTAAVSVMDNGMLRSDLMTLTFPQAALIQATLDKRHPKTIEHLMTERARKQGPGREHGNQPANINHAIRDHSHGKAGHHGPKEPLKLALEA